MKDNKQSVFNTEEYLAKFTNKEQIKEELARLQKNIENIKFGRIDLKSLLWYKKRVLLDKFNKEYCRVKYYIDDLGRRDWFYEEI